MKKYFDTVVSNELLRKRLADDILGDTLNHAYIIEGKYGTGKHTIAKLVAAAISCTNKNDGNKPLPCLVCPNCRKIIEEKTPDLIFVNRGDKATLGVEEIREMCRDICFAPNEMNLKVYVIEDAHLMTAQAQNAFLLTLEEPPEYVFFLLLCENAGALLETVRSRAPLLRTEILCDGELAKLITEKDRVAASLAKNSKEEFFEIIRSSGGSPGRAYELLDPKEKEKLFAKRGNIKKFVSCALGKKNGYEVIPLLNSLDGKREELTDFFGGVLSALRDLMALKKDENAPLVFYSSYDEALDICDKTSSKKISDMYDKVSGAMSAISQNANIKLTLINLAASSGMI